MTINRALRVVDGLGGRVLGRLGTMGRLMMRVRGRDRVAVMDGEQGGIHDVGDRLAAAREVAELLRACAEDVDGVVALLEAALQQIQSRRAS